MPPLGPHTSAVGQRENGSGGVGWGHYFLWTTLSLWLFSVNDVCFWLFSVNDVCFWLFSVNGVAVGLSSLFSAGQSVTNSVDCHH